MLVSVLPKHCQLPVKYKMMSKNSMLNSRFGYSSQEEIDTDTDIDNPFLGIDFWCGDSEYLGRRSCCFNHMIGLPQKNGIYHPIYDYELELKDIIEQYQHVWTKKARGIGFTTFLTRYLGWKATATDELHNKDIFIIAGTKSNLGNEIKT